MRLRAKIILVSSLATAGVAISSATVASYATWATAVSAIDSNLEYLAQSASASKDPVGTALLNLDTQSADTELGFYSIDKDFTVLSDADQVIGRHPSVGQMQAASTKTLTIRPTDSSSYRLRTSALPDGEFLVFATSLDKAQQTTWFTAGLLGSVSLLTLLLGALLIWALTRRDLKRVERLIAKAEQIAAGDFEVQLEVARGDSEIEKLNNSLASMVTALKSAIDTERALQASMRDFVADAGHELKTPLTVIRGYFELLFQGGKVDKDVLERSKSRVNDQLLRMQALISDLLLLAEIEGKSVEQKTSVDFSDVVATAFEDFATLNPEHRVELRVEPDLKVQGSERLLTQLLANITSNLSRYVPAGVHIQVVLKAMDGQLQLCVDDAGPGLPDSAYAEGVQRFTRFDESRSRESGGSGLGISIMAAIVEQHGGSLELSRSQFGGLRTTVTLPADY